MYRSLLASVFIPLIIAAGPVQAINYYENTRLTYRSYPTYTHSSYNYYPTYRYPTYTDTYRPRSAYPYSATQRQSSSRNCLYRNAQGECMIEQYFDPHNIYYGNYNYVPVYDRDYLYRERRYSNRDDDDDDRYDYRYFDDDDDYRAIDDDDFYNDDDDDFDDDDFFDDDDDSDDDDDD